MSRWFRHYAGMMRDDKLVRVAIRSKQSIERVCWIYGAILESAAEANADGTYDVDTAEIAYFLRADEADILAVFAELESGGHLYSGAVVKWGDRQFKSDSSADRQAAYRERKRRARNADGEVTSPSRHRDAPETDTETNITPLVPLGRGKSGKTLIPADWTAPPVSELPPRSRACAEQWTDASYQTEAEGFVLYWRNERKMKVNWRDTWANRIIARHEAVMRAQKFGNAPTDKHKKQEKTAQEWRELAEWYVRHGQPDRAEECRRKAIAQEQVIAA